MSERRSSSRGRERDRSASGRSDRSDRSNDSRSNSPPGDSVVVRAPPRSVVHQITPEQRVDQVLSKLSDSDKATIQSYLTSQPAFQGENFSGDWQEDSDFNNQYVEGFPSEADNQDEDLLMGPTEVLASEDALERYKSDRVRMLISQQAGGQELISTGVSKLRKRYGATGDPTADHPATIRNLFDGLDRVAHVNTGIVALIDKKLERVDSSVALARRPLYYMVDRIAAQKEVMGAQELSKTERQAQAAVEWSLVALADARLQIQAARRIAVLGQRGFPTHAFKNDALRPLLEAPLQPRTMDERFGHSGDPARMPPLLSSFAHLEQLTEHSKKSDSRQKALQKFAPKARPARGRPFNRARFHPYAGASSSPGPHFNPNFAQGYQGQFPQQSPGYFYQRGGFQGNQFQRGGFHQYGGRGRGSRGHGYAGQNYQQYQPFQNFQYQGGASGHTKKEPKTAK